MNLRFRSLGSVSFVVVALLTGACGDDDGTNTTSVGGGGGGTTSTASSSSVASSVASTTTTTTSSQSSSSGDGGSNQGGGGSGQGGEPGVGGQGGEPAQGGGGSGQGGEPGVGGAGGEGGNPLEPSALFVASNPAARDADGALRVPLELGAAEATYPGPADIVGLQNVALEGNDDGWISYDVVGATGGIMFVSNLETLATGSLGAGTRRIQGPNTGLLTPKGVRVIGDEVLVADTTARTISAWDVSDEGDVEPLYVIDDFGLANRAIWDFDYDVASDILYAAATDGVVVAFDDFSTDSGANGPSRTFTPSAGGAQISVNLHGIEFVESNLINPDVLVLTDVGDAAVATDGQLFTIADPDEADGTTNVRARVFGANSLLGNPVDLDVDDGSVYIAEKSNDRLLRYDNIAGLTSSGDLAANGSYTVTKPESVEVGAGVLADIQIISNPAGRDLDALVRTDALFAVTEATVGTPGFLQSIQSLALDQAGNAYATLDAVGPSGSILVFDDLAGAATATPLAGGSRRIEGGLTNLVAPKGLLVTEISGNGILLVADTGAAARDVKGYALDAEGNTSPLITVSDLGADRAPWDIDYDIASDRLYVACTDGVVAVFDEFSGDLGANGPDRVFTPAVAGAGVSTNLHGIQYLADSDTLVLSDVGDAAVATDGRIYTIAAASTATGLVDVGVRISGNDTLLGNPVDLVVVDGDVYIAEKINDRILRYNGIVGLSGEVTTAADQSATITKPESVFVRYE